MKYDLETLLNVMITAAGKEKLVVEFVHGSYTGNMTAVIRVGNDYVYDGSYHPSLDETLANCITNYPEWKAQRKASK